MKLNSFDIELLEHMDGRREGGDWGSWVTECIEYLHENGLVEPSFGAKGVTYTITEAGREALKEHSNDTD